MKLDRKGIGSATVLIVLAAVAFGTVGPPAVAEAVGVQPDSSFYSLQRAGEAIRAPFEDDLDWNLMLAERRLDEFTHIVEKEKGDQYTFLIEEAYSHLIEAAIHAEDVEQLGRVKGDINEYSLKLENLRTVVPTEIEAEIKGLQLQSFVAADGIEKIAKEVRIQEIEEMELENRLREIEVKGKSLVEKWEPDQEFELSGSREEVRLETGDGSLVIQIGEIRKDPNIREIEKSIVEIEKTYPENLRFEVGPIENISVDLVEENIRLKLGVENIEIIKLDENIIEVVDDIEIEPIDNLEIEPPENEWVRTNKDSYVQREDVEIYFTNQADKPLEFGDWLIQKYAGGNGVELWIDVYDPLEIVIGQMGPGRTRERTWDETDEMDPGRYRVVWKPEDPDTAETYNRFTTEFNIIGIEVRLPLTVGVEGEGIVHVNGQEVEDEATKWFELGEEVMLTAEPDDNWIFLEWTGDYPEGESKEETITVTMDGSKEIIAKFAEIRPIQWVQTDKDWYLPGENVEIYLTNLSDKPLEFGDWLIQKYAGGNGVELWIDVYDPLEIVIGQMGPGRTRERTWDETDEMDPGRYRVVWKPEDLETNEPIGEFTTEFEIEKSYEIR